MSADTLYAQILNLQIVGPVPVSADDSPAYAYRLGHQNARHAAAELVLAAQPSMSALPTPICRDDTQHGVDYYTRADLEAEAEARCAPLVEALQMLYDDTADYIRLNKLGGMDNHCMQLARAALAAHKGKP